MSAEAGIQCTAVDSRLRYPASEGPDNGRLTAGSSRANQPDNHVAANAPSSCAAMKPGASAGRMPAKVSLRARAIVTAGLANEVEPR